MNDNLNIQLLKQHAAILQSALKTVNTVSQSISEEAEALGAEMSGPTMADAMEALAACERAQERARTAEAKLGGVNAMLRRAIEDLHFVMAGGDACKVCALKCTFGTGECKPVWKGEEAEE